MCDERDRVYAFLALDSGDLLLKPDYGISVEELFLRLLEPRLDRFGPTSGLPYKSKEQHIKTIILLDQNFGLNDDQMDTITRLSKGRYRYVYGTLRDDDNQLVRLWDVN